MAPQNRAGEIWTETFVDEKWKNVPIKESWAELPSDEKWTEVPIEPQKPVYDPTKPLTRARGAGPGAVPGTPLPPPREKSFEEQAIDQLEKNPNLSTNPLTTLVSGVGKVFNYAPFKPAAEAASRMLTEPVIGRRREPGGKLVADKPPLDLSKIPVSPEKKAEIQRLYQSDVYENKVDPLLAFLGGSLEGAGDLASVGNIALAAAGSGEVAALNKVRKLLALGKIAEARTAARTALNLERATRATSTAIGAKAGYETGEVLADPDKTWTEKGLEILPRIPEMAGAGLGMRPRVRQQVSQMPVPNLAGQGPRGVPDIPIQIEGRGTVSPDLDLNVPVRSGGGGGISIDKLTYQPPGSGTSPYLTSQPTGPADITTTIPAPEQFAEKPSQRTSAINIRPGPTQLDIVMRMTNAGYKIARSDENGIMMIPTDAPLPTQATPLSTGIETEHPFGEGKLPGDDEGPAFARRPSPPAVEPFGDIRSPQRPSVREMAGPKLTKLIEEDPRFTSILNELNAMSPEQDLIPRSKVDLTTPISEEPLFASRTPKRPFRSNPLRPDLGFEKDWNTGVFPRETGAALDNQFARARALGLDPNQYKGSGELTEAIYNRRMELGLKPGEEPRVDLTTSVSDEPQFARRTPDPSDPLNVEDYTGTRSTKDLFDSPRTIFGVPEPQGGKYRVDMSIPEVQRIMSLTDKEELEDIAFEVGTKIRELDKDAQAKGNVRGELTPENKMLIKLNNAVSTRLNEIVRGETEDVQFARRPDIRREGPESKRTARELELERIYKTYTDPEERQKHVDIINKIFEDSPEETIKILREENHPALAEAEAIYREQDPQKIIETVEKLHSKLAAMADGIGDVPPEHRAAFEDDYETTGILHSLAADKAERTTQRMLEGRVDFAQRPTDASGRPLKAEEMTQEQADTYKKELASDWGKARSAAKKFGVDIKGMRDLDEVLAKIHQAATSEATRVVATGLKTSMNVQRAAQNIAKDYSGSVPGIMVREGLQNAFDAVKLAIRLGKIGKDDGRVEIIIKSTSLTISDNGLGMTLEELMTVYKDLNESGKVSEEGASGGKGIGKATYMLGGEHFTATTTAKDANGKTVRHTFEGTPNQFINRGYNISEVDVPQDTPLGTTFTTTFLKSSSDAKVHADVMLELIKVWSRDIPVTITPTVYQYADPDFKVSSLSEDKKLGEMENKGNKYEVYLPKTPKMSTKSKFVNIKVLNNGMYQFNLRLTLDKELPDIPEDIIVEIKPVEEFDIDDQGNSIANADYPFPMQRESLKEDVEKLVTDFVKQVYFNPIADKVKQELMTFWNDLPNFPQLQGLTARKPLFFDSGSRLTPDEMHDFTSNSKTIRLTQLFDNLIQNILDVSDPGEKVSQYTGNVLEPAWKDRVKFTGMLLSGRVNGLHIPDPSADGQTSAILINGWNAMLDHPSPRDAAMAIIVTAQHEVAHVGTKERERYEDMTPEDLNDPLVGDYLSAYLKELKQQGGLDYSHGMPFAKRMNDIWVKFGTRRASEYVERILRIITDPITGGYNADIKALLQIYSESRGRPEVKADILSRTGEKSGVTGGGTSAMDRDNSPTSDRLTGGASEEIEFARRRVKRPPRRTNAGEVVRVSLKHERLPKDKGRELVKGAMDAGFVSTGFRDAAGIPIWEKPKDVPTNVINELWNLPRGLKSVDLPFMTSAILRQGITMLGVDPKSFARAWANSMRAYGSNASYEIIKDELSKNPYFRRGLDKKGNETPSIAERVGIALTDTKNMTKQEEILKSAWSEKFLTYRGYGYGQHVAASNRAYTAFVNTLRAGALSKFFDQGKLDAQLLKDKMLDPSLNLKLGREIADAINTLTGRGKAEVEFVPNTRLSKAQFPKGVPLVGGMRPFKQRKLSVEGEGAVRILANTFFSPRLQMSRLKLVNINTYISASPQVRKMYIKGMLSLLGVWGSIAMLVKLSGIGDIDLNPRSADFGKIRIGNTRFDGGAGFLQLIVLLFRWVTGQFTSSTSGETRELREGFRPITPGEITQNFIFSKFHPSGKFIVDYAYGTDDKPFFVVDKTLDQFAPMFASGLNEVLNEEPWLLAPVLLGSSYGLGTQTYPDRPDKKAQGRQITPLLERMGLPIGQFDIRIPEGRWR